MSSSCVIFSRGAPHEAAKWASIPIINGGDGWGEHPAQILTTFIPCCAKKAASTASSGGWGYAHAHHALPGVRANPVRLPHHVRRPTEHGVDTRIQRGNPRLQLEFREAERETGVSEADVILVEPVILADYSKHRDVRSEEVGAPDNYKITRELPLANKAKSDAILLHSLPRMDEAHWTWISRAGPATGRKPLTGS